jgi:hypothetical protein
VSVPTGTPVNYNYSFCYNSNSNYYTVQIEDVTTSTPAQQMQTVLLNGQAGTVSSGGSFTPTAPDRYKITVEYFEQGQSVFEDEGEAIFFATTPVNGGGDPTPPTSNPGPGVTPGGPTPVSTPGQNPVVKTPLVPNGPTKTPTSTPGSGPAKLCLSETEKAKSVQQGGVEAWVLKVKNCGGSKATGVKVTDPLIPGISLTNLGHGKLNRGKLVFNAGDLAAGKTKTFQFVAHFATNAPTGNQTNRPTAKGSNTNKAAAPIVVLVIALPQAPIVAPVTG